MKIEIKNGHVIDPRHGVDRNATLYIAAGKVAALGEAPAGWHANRVLDATGLVVCPGLIDISARLREPGFEYKATLDSEMAAAIAGGVTSLACPPDTDPPLDEPGLVQMLKHRARSLNGAHVHPIGALTVGLKGETITEMGELTEAGCIAFSHADAALSEAVAGTPAPKPAAGTTLKVEVRTVTASPEVPRLSFAVVDAPLGSGHVVLFAMRPQYRAQSYSTFKMFFNSLVYFE